MQPRPDRRGPHARRRLDWRSIVGDRRRRSSARGPTPARSKTPSQGLAASSEDKIEESIRKLAALDDPRAIPALDALCDDRLRVGADGHPYIWDSKTRDVRHPLTGARGVASAAAAEGGRGRQRDSPRGAAGAGAAPARHRRRPRCGWRPPRSCRRAGRPRRRRCCTGRWSGRRTPACARRWRWPWRAPICGRRSGRRASRRWTHRQERQRRVSFGADSG